MKNVMLLVLAGLLVGTGFFFSATLYPARAEAQQTSATTCRTEMISGSYVYSIQDTIIFSPPFPPGPAALVGGFQADGHGNLLHGQERALYGDQAYWSEMHRFAAKQHGVRYRVNRRPNRGQPLSAYQRRVNRLRSATRARGEHAFQIIKHLWGFRKVRYRGLAKNTARLFTMFALANLYMVRRRLLAT